MAFSAFAPQTPDMPTPFSSKNGLVEVRTPSSNRNKVATAARAFARPVGASEQSEVSARQKMVDLDEAGLNQLFDTLADWTTILEAHESVKTADSEPPAPEPL